MANLITGYRGTEHVTAADAGSFNAAAIGSGKYVFNNGQSFKAEVVSNNLVRVYDGDMLNQGRHIRIDTGDYEDAEIATGLVDTYRNDLIVMRYTKDAESQVESAAITVIQGVSGDTAVDPEYIEGDILNGVAEVDDVPLYRVKLEGLSIVKVEALFEATDSVMALVASLKSDLDGRLSQTTISTATDFNNLTETGLYHISVKGCPNAPSNNWGTLYVSNCGTLYQIYIPDSNYMQYKRIYTNGVWSDWECANLSDSGWIDVTPNTGTWEYFQYRKIGNRVTVRGRASALTLNSGFGVGTVLTVMPSGYRPSKQIYMDGYSTAMVKSRMFVAIGGSLGIDWSWNYYTNSMSEMDTWFHFEVSYYVD